MKHTLFLSESELRQIKERNTLLGQDSILISKGVVIGENNIFYPNVVIECHEQGSINIGNGNTFYPGTYILSTNGKIKIQNNSEFGPAGLTIKANFPGAEITIGNNGRYSDGASIMGKTTLGSGSQVLGNITVQNCHLSEGEPYHSLDPDLRGAVLKGMGLARNISLKTGQVMNGLGDFSKAQIEQQSSYHPKMT